jgi:histone deacetylase 1/2
LAGDRLGTHNTSIKAHGACVRLVKSWGLPTMILGGGGYTIKNVARCWTYETALSVNQTLEDNLPLNDYYDFFGPDYSLHYKPGEEQSMNSAEYLDFVKTRCFQHLK